MQQLLTSDEVATALRVDVVTVRRLVMRGDVAAYRVGGEYRFTATDLEDYLHRQRVPLPDETGTSRARTLAQLLRTPFARDQAEPFTEQARTALELAHGEAERRGHSVIGPEHLLLGLVRQGEGPVFQVLHDLGVDVTTMSAAVEGRLGAAGVRQPERRSNSLNTRETGLSPQAMKALHLAVEEAQRLNDRGVDGEHLLLGLVREGESAAAQVLISLGVDLTSARATVTQVRHEARPADPPPIPSEAARLVEEGNPGITCGGCGARCPSYFHYCFNCGALLRHQET